MAKSKLVTVAIIFIVSFFLFQILEDTIAATEDFPLKGLIQLLIPGPQDSVFELLQFLAYWIGGFWFFKDK